MDIFYGHTTPYKALSVHPSIGWSVGPSVGVIKTKSGKNERLNHYLCKCVWERGLGLDAPAHPSATILSLRVTCF